MTVKRFPLFIFRVEISVSTGFTIVDIVLLISIKSLSPYFRIENILRNLKVYKIKLNEMIVLKD